MLKIAFIDLGSRLVQYFAEVARQMEPNIQSYFYCTKPKAYSIAKRSGFPTFPNKGDVVDTGMVPSDIESEILNDKILTENPDRKKLADRLHRLYPSLRAFLENHRIDAVFLWNGSGLAASTAIHLARSMGLKTVFGENGYFYNTLQIDPVGVNQASSITEKIEREYRQQKIEAGRLQELDAVIDSYRSGANLQKPILRETVRPSLLARLSEELSNLRQMEFKWPKSMNTAIPSEPEALPQKYIFLPFQVVKDSQLLLYSPLVGNDMEFFLDTCRTALHAVAGDYAIVVKLHPADIRNIDYSRLVTKYPDVIFLKDYPANKLIKHASLVITINSTVGVEALIYEKPVITLGLNFYNVPDIVFHVDDLADLQDAIRTGLATPPNKDKIRQLLYYLYHHYFTHGSWKDHSPQSVAAVATKISGLLTSDS